MLSNTRGNWGRVRRSDEVTRLVGDLEVTEPGLVEISTWRPDEQTAEEQPTHEWFEFGGVAIKR